MSASNTVLTLLRSISKPHPYSTSVITRNKLSDKTKWELAERFTLARRVSASFTTVRQGPSSIAFPRQALRSLHPPPIGTRAFHASAAARMGVHNLGK